MSIYRYTKNPVRIGQVRHKAWSWLLPPTGEADPVWAERAKAYWELQQETYGLKLSNFTLAVDWQEQVVVTYTIVLDVLPGERRVDYVVPRVKDERARRAPLQHEPKLASRGEVPIDCRICPACGGAGGAHRFNCDIVAASVS